MARFAIEKLGPDRYAVKNVPIFKTHDDRGYPCDEQWMQAAVQNHQRYAQENDWLPTVVIGHTTKGGAEKEAVGFLDNFKFDKSKGVLYADITNLPGDVKNQLERNAYPNRSVEVLPKSKRILALALLGGTAPHFALPQMRYANEESEWFRSKPMNGNEQTSGQGGFSDEQRQELYQMVGEAAQSAIADTFTPEPETYQIDDDDAMQLLQSGEMPELMEDDEGNVFTYDEDENAVYYVSRNIANVLKGVQRGAGAVGRAVRGGVQKAGQAVRGGAQKVGQTAASAGGRFKTGFRSAGQASMGGRYTRGAPSYRTGRAVGQGVQAARNHPYITGGIGAGVGAAGAGVMAARRRGREYEMDEVPEGYAFDANGVVYQNGEPVGKIVPLASGEMGLAPEDLPQSGQGTATVVPQINPAAVGVGTPEPTGQEMDPGPLTADEIEELPMDEEDEAMQASELGMEPEQYELHRRVQTLERANSLLQNSNKAEHLRQYLMNQKKGGAPVGDIDTTLNYLMGQDDEQVQRFKKILESQPKVALGSSDEGAQTYTTDEAQVRADYEQHKQEYKALGVDENSLKYAGYVRIGPGNQRG